MWSLRVFSKTALVFSYSPTICRLGGLEGVVRRLHTCENNEDASTLSSSKCLLYLSSSLMLFTHMNTRQRGKSGSDIESCSVSTASQSSITQTMHWGAGRVKSI